MENLKQPQKYTKVATLFLMAVSCLPFTFLVRIPSSLDTSSLTLKAWSLYTSSVLGYIGVGMMLWQFILGTRTIGGLFIRDFSWSIKVHNFMGKYGSLLIFMHPIFIGLAYGYSLSQYIVPNFSSSFNFWVSMGRLALVCLIIIWVTSALVRGWIKYRPWKLLHLLAYPMIIMAMLHAQQIGHSFTSPYIKFFWFSFGVLLLIVFVLRLRIIFGFGTQVYSIADQQQLANKIFLLRLTPQQKAISFQSGQFVYVRSGLTGESHPFSIVDIDSKGNLVLIYKVFGKFTKKLSKFATDRPIYIDGPYGEYSFEITKNPQAPVVFIAGGIGITPFIKHAVERSKAQLPTKLIYFVGDRTQAVLDNIFKEDLGDDYKLVETNKNQFSLQTEITKLISNDKACLYYVCGPTGFMDKVTEILISDGIDKYQIHFEEFSF